VYIAVLLSIVSGINIAAVPELTKFLKLDVFDGLVLTISC
jgi:hypothetical protein